MILLKKLKSIYKLLLISILATFTVASSANSIELKGYYGSISANLFDGEAFQDKGDLGNWSSVYPRNPQWDYEETSVGINFGKCLFQENLIILRVVVDKNKQLKQRSYE